MHVFLALDVDHDCRLFVPDILTIFQDIGNPILLDDAKDLLSGHYGHNHHDGVDFSLWKKLILGEVFKDDDMTLLDEWRYAFAEVKKSFNTVGDVMTTNINNAAKTAVKALKHGSELGECYKGELVKVETASVEVMEGLQYKLELKISTMGGADCMENIEMICDNIMLKKPLPKDCQGTADALKLINREHIVCEKVEATSTTVASTTGTTTASTTVASTTTSTTEASTTVASTATSTTASTTVASAPTSTTTASTTVASTTSTTAA